MSSSPQQIFIKKASFYFDRMYNFERDRIMKLSDSPEKEAVMKKLVEITRPTTILTKRHIVDWCIENYERVKQQIPTLMPEEFIAAVVFFYSSIYGTYRKSLKNSLEATVSFTAQESEVFPKFRDYFIGSVDFPKEEYSQIKKSHDNVNTCLIFLSEDQKLGMGSLLKSPEQLFDEYGGQSSVRGGKRMRMRSKGKRTRNQKTKKRNKRRKNGKK
jgi:hypothetical protein